MQIDDTPCFPLPALLHVCHQAIPYAHPVRTLRHVVTPRWFAPRTQPPHEGDERHLHLLYEAQICLAGQAWFTMEHPQQIGPGSVTLVPPGGEHAWQTDDEGCLFLWAGFSIEPAVRVYEPAQWPVWPTVLQDVSILLEERRLGLRGWAERAGMRLTLLLARVLTLADLHSQHQAVGMATDGFRREVQRYCDMYFDRPVRIEHLAQYFQMSPRTFSRRVQQCLGTTVRDLLQQHRLQHATWLLTNSALPIQDIAGQCGLPNAAHFCHLFRRAYGMSPTDYRKYSHVSRVS
jgi:AraC-like DNA-binding protein